MLVFGCRMIAYDLIRLTSSSVISRQRIASMPAPTNAVEEVGLRSFVCASL
jgi:hypothetical protein